MRAGVSEVGKGTTLHDGDGSMVTVVTEKESPSTCMESTPSRSTLIVEAVSAVFVVNDDDDDADAVAKESLHVGRARRSGVGWKPSIKLE